MATLTIRNLDQAVKERLRIGAAEHGRSMEAEARRILQTALGESPRAPERNIYERVHARFAALGGGPAARTIDDVSATNKTTPARNAHILPCPRLMVWRITGAVT